MNKGILLALIGVLIVVVLWPWFLLVILGVALAAWGLILYHQHGKWEPQIFFGDDPTHSIVLRWVTREPVTSEAFLTLSSKLRRERRIRGEPSTTSPGTRHETTFTGLEPGRRYYYHISTAAGKCLYRSRRHTFRTAPAPGDPKFDRVRFALVGDLQVQDSLAIIQSFFIRKVHRLDLDFFLSMGDLVHRYNSPKAWQILKVVVRGLMRNRPFYTTPGNHDYGRDQGATLGTDQQFQPPGGWENAFQWGNVLVISINSMETGDSSAEKTRLAWLDQVLRNRDEGVDFTIFFTHIPWFGPDYDGKGGMVPVETYLRQAWVPLLEKHGVDLVFCGHKHMYYREQRWVISGAMHGIRGYPEQVSGEVVSLNKHHYCLIEVRGKVLEMRAISWRGKILEQVVIHKPK